VSRAALFAAFFLFAAMPAAAQRIPEGGCIHRKLSVVTQGAKLMARCYSQAARQSIALDQECLERTVARMKNGLTRLDLSGCDPTHDTNALVGLTSDYVSAVAIEIADPKKPASSTPSPATPAATPGLTPEAP
jgi:hypothetical protein